MRSQATFALILIISISSLYYISPSGAQSFGTIYIRPNGSIEPSTAPVLRVGDLYILSENLYDSPIVLERNNMVFDGGGYALEGAKTGTALNITCSNVTVQNLRVLNWEVGLLGAYNNVTIHDCYLTGNGKGIAIYADNYTVSGNFIAQNEWGIRVNGNHNDFFDNQILNNTVGIWITYLYGGGKSNRLVSNTIEVDGQIAVETDNGEGFEIYHNNFIIHKSTSPIVSTAFLVIPGDETKVVMPPWDNGAEGNYWSNYEDKYPNAVEVDNTGIYETAYTISIAPNLTDRYPLTKQVNIAEFVLPTPNPSQPQNPSTTPTLTPSETASSSPTLFPTESPSASPSLSEQPTSIPSPIDGIQPDLWLYAVAGILIVSGVLAVAFYKSKKAASSKNKI